MREYLSDLVLDKTVEVCGVELPISLTFDAAPIDTGAGEYEHFGFKGSDHAYGYELDGAPSLFIAQSINGACRECLAKRGFPKTPRRRYLRKLRILVKHVNAALEKVDPRDLLEDAEFDRVTEDYL